MMHKYSQWQPIHITASSSNFDSRRKKASNLAQGMSKATQLVISGSKKFGSTVGSGEGLEGSRYRDRPPHGSAVDPGSLMKK
jgi:hypothetical protein